MSNFSLNDAGRGLRSILDTHGSKAWRITTQVSGGVEILLPSGSWKFIEVESIKETARQKDVQFDYENQAWIVDGKYVRCGHPEDMVCGCYGRIHAGKEFTK